MTIFFLFLTLSALLGRLDATSWPQFKMGGPLEELNLNLSSISDFLNKHGKLKANFKLRGGSLAKNEVNLMHGYFLDGYVEVTSFSDQNPCTGSVVGKYFYQLNKCGVFLVNGLYVKYLMKEEDDESYKFGALIYSDNACQNKIAQDFTTLAKTGCGKGTTNVPRATLPDLSTVGLAVVLGAYEDAASCAANSDASKLVGVSLLKKNACVKGVPSDIFINGCDEQGQLVGTFYETTDGSCTGNPIDRIRLAPGTDCSNFGPYGPLSFGGYRNFKCLA